MLTTEKSVLGVRLDSVYIETEQAAMQTAGSI